jgi:hypothetical protein
MEENSAGWNNEFGHTSDEAAKRTEIMNNKRSGTCSECKLKFDIAVSPNT